MAIRLRKFFGIFSIVLCSLTFVKEDAAALESGDKATPLFVQNFSVVTEENAPRGLTFSNDGTKMFVVGEQSNNSATSGGANDDIHEYTLSTAFDISTASYVDSLANAGDNNENSLKFNNDGSKMFVTGRGNNTVREYSLTANFDLSSATFESFFSVNSDDGTLFGLDFNNDGTMMYITGHENDTIHQYELAVGFDLSEGVTLLRSQDLSAQDGEPSSIEFNTDGTRMFIIGTLDNGVDQYDLSTGFDVSTLSHVGFLSLSDEEVNPSGIAFSSSGLRMFITGNSGDEINEYHLSCPFNLFSGKCPSITKNKDRTGIAEAQIMIAKRTIDHSTQSALHRLEWIRRNKDNQNLTNLNNFNTAIQFDNPLLNYWVKKFPDKLVAVNEEVEGGRSITIGREYKNRDRNSNNLDNFNTAIKSDNPLLNSWMDKLPEKIAARQASVKKKTEDKKQVLNSWMNKLSEKITARQASAKKKTKDKKQDLFFWSEGSIAVGRVGDTSISSTKKIGTEAITLGVDKFTNNDEIKGLAFRIGNNNIDVGTAGSNLDTDTFNLTYYATSPVENDTKFKDVVIGFGKLKLDMLTVLDGKHIKASRDGSQMYITHKLKDEIKKDGFILIPSFQVDAGHTILDGYTESGIGAIKVEDQNISTVKLRTAIAMSDDLMKVSTFCPGIKNETCFIKRHGKIEYMVDLNRSSNFKYTYVSDNTQNFNEKLHSGALHNVNGEVGIDIILPDNFSIFLIYERNQALGVGHTDNINIAIGYLPNKKTNYAFKLEGSENIGSEYKISKNTNDFEIDFKLKNPRALKPNTVDEVFINVIRKF